MMWNPELVESYARMRSITRALSLHPASIRGSQSSFLIEDFTDL